MVPDGTCRKVLLTLVCFTGQLVVMGLYYSYGQLFAALKHETGESGGKLALIGSSRDFLLNGIMALRGFGVKKIGGHVTLSTLGSALVVLSLIFDSIVPNTSWLFLSFSLIGGIGSGLLCIPYYTVLYSQMSGPMLPVAVGFAAAGGGVGTIVFNSTLEPLDQTFGWRYARQILAAALLVILTLNTLVLRCCMRQQKEGPDDSVEESNSSTSSDASSGSQPSQFRLGKELVELVRPFTVPSFGLLSVGLVLYMFGFTVPYTHVVYYAELQGYKRAAMLVSVMGAGSTVGRILCGIGAAVVPPRRLFLLVILVQGLSLAWLPTCSTEAELMTFSVIFGGSSGARVALLSLLVCELYGAEKVPHLFGLAGLAIGVGTLIGPTLVGSIFDLSGSYSTAFLTSACLVLASIPCMLASYWYVAQQREVSKADLEEV